MTAPVDHRPYAGTGDLVTAEDVAEWLDTLHRGPPAERIFGVQDAIVALDARLDRERRQACRRGALESWRRVADLVRFARQYRNRDRGWDAHGHGVWHYLTLALAFRAAARAR